MKLYLFRHGAAEHVLGKKDFDRVLTEEGIRKLEKYLPDSAPYWKGKKLRLFTSPKLRALQTAELLAPYCGDAEVELLPILTGGHTRHLLDALSEVEQDGSEHFILTGHEPFLSYWTYELTHQNQNYNKGGIGVIELPDPREQDAAGLRGLENGKGNLLVYLKLREVKNLKQLD